MERAPRAGLEGAAAARGAGCRCSEVEPLCGEGLFSLPFCALRLGRGAANGFSVRVLRAR